MPHSELELCTHSPSNLNIHTEKCFKLRTFFPLSIVIFPRMYKTERFLGIFCLAVTTISTGIAYIYTPVGFLARTRVQEPYLRVWYEFDAPKLQGGFGSSWLLAGAKSRKKPDARRGPKGIFKPRSTSRDHLIELYTDLAGLSDPDWVPVLCNVNSSWIWTPEYILASGDSNHSNIYSRNTPDVKVLTIIITCGWNSDAIQLLENLSDLFTLPSRLDVRREKISKTERVTLMSEEQTTGM